MALRHIGFDQIDEACLQRLIDTGAAEARDIEYKSATYGGNDDARAEFLADVSSLANTVGGDLILGMVANNGIPTAFAPLTTDVEKECLRLDSMARDGLEPRISQSSDKAGTVIVGRCRNPDPDPPKLQPAASSGLQGEESILGAILCREI